MPISRFASDLKRQGKLAEYMCLLIDSFNPGAVDGVMCRSLVSVGWDGSLYDCDFNQMLDMRLVEGGVPLRIGEVEPAQLLGRAILVDDHCYGCTAGAGSSCGGALV